MILNFVFFSISDNYGAFHRRREIEAIATEIEAEGGQVVYFTTPQLLFKKMFKTIITRLNRKQVEVSVNDKPPNIHVFNLYTLLPKSIAVSNRFLLHLFVTLPVRMQIAWAKKSCIKNKKFINWFYKPDQYLYLDTSKPFIYLHYDNYKGDKSYTFSQTKQFDEVLKSCISDSLFTLVSSAKLFNQYKTIEPNKVIYYPNAISRSLIKPKDSISQANKKSEQLVIGFIGQLDKTFDVELLEKISTNFKQCKIKLVGPVTEQEIVAVATRNNNIELLGYMSYEELNNQIKSFSIGICPYKQNEFNRYRNPLKIFEYFSYGLPVVSVQCDIDERMCDLIGVAADHQTFLDLISKELNSNNSDKERQRLKFAEENCWDNRVQLVMHKLKSSIK